MPVNYSVSQVVSDYYLTWLLKITGLAGWTFSPSGMLRTFLLKQWDFSCYFVPVAA